MKPQAHENDPCLPKGNCALCLDLPRHYKSAEFPDSRWQINTHRRSLHCASHRHNQGNANMNSSANTTELAPMACGTPMSCHPLLLFLGLIYVFFFLLFLVNSTCWNMRNRLSRWRDLEQKEGDVFEKVVAYGGGGIGNTV